MLMLRNRSIEHKEVKKIKSVGIIRKLVYCSRTKSILQQERDHKKRNSQFLPLRFSSAAPLFHPHGRVPAVIWR